MGCTAGWKACRRQKSSPSACVLYTDTTAAGVATAIRVMHISPKRSVPACRQAKLRNGHLRKLLASCSCGGVRRFTHSHGLVRLGDCFFDASCFTRGSASAAIRCVQPRKQQAVEVIHFNVRLHCHTVTDRHARLGGCAPVDGAEPKEEGQASERLPVMCVMPHALQPHTAQPPVHCPAARQS